MESVGRFVKYDDLNEGGGHFNSQIYHSLKDLFEPIISKEFSWFPGSEFVFDGAANVTGTDNLQLEFQMTDEPIELEYDSYTSSSGFIQTYIDNKDKIISNLSRALGSSISPDKLIEVGLSPDQFVIKVVSIKSRLD